MSKVLIVDDDAINRMILEGMLIKDGHEVLQAVNGRQAIDSFLNDKPEMILMDIMMPVMNGYEATVKVKELAGDEFIPIIVLTAMTDESDLVKCVDSGADDFLTKPFSHAILTAKIHALFRMKSLYHTISEQRNQIELNRTILHDEQEQAARIYKRMTTRDEIEGLDVRFHMSPMSIFNGDMLLKTKSPDGSICIFLTDATGHGLPAALGAFPVRDIFYTMIEKGCSPKETIEELNRKMFEILPTEFFLCGAMLVISSDKKTYHIWNGGMPSVVIYRPGTHQIIEKVNSSNLPLGIVSTDSYSTEFKEVDIEVGDTIVMYSDGITEARRGKGEYFGDKRFFDAIVSSSEYQIIDMVLKAVSRFCGDNSQTDDVSLVEYTVTEP